MCPITLSHRAHSPPQSRLPNLNLYVFIHAKGYFPGGPSFVTEAVSTRTDLLVDVVAGGAVDNADERVSVIVTRVTANLTTGKGTGHPLGTIGVATAGGDTTIWALVQVQEVDGTIGRTMDMVRHRMVLQMIDWNRRRRCSR
jgi:hypothetical protein